MNNDKLVVREVHLKPGCFSRRDNPEVEPTLVCPLCVLEGHRRPTERTATYGLSGHIWCHRGCGRYSAILMRTLREEIPLVPVELTSPRQLDAQSRAINMLRSSLSGAGDLLEKVAMDDIQPDVTVGFVLEKLRLTRGQLDAGSQVEPEMAPGNDDDSFQPLGVIPPSLRRLMSRGRIEFGVG